MASAMKFDVENDFGLWRVKMRALLVQQELAEALEGANSLPTSMSERDKKVALEKAHSAIILSLGDKVLWEVSKEKSVEEV